jgi:hypothetical protein
MKPREAINAIRVNMPTSGTYTVLTQALNMAIELFEKQIPKLPRPDDNGVVNIMKHGLNVRCAQSLYQNTQQKMKHHATVSDAVKDWSGSRE